MPKLPVDINKIASELSKRDEYETWGKQSKDDDAVYGDISHSTDAETDRMVEEFDIIHCDYCGADYSLLEARWLRGDCVCPHCNRIAGETI